MAFKTKTLSDLIRSTENALSVRFYGETTVLRKGVLKTLAAVVGGALFIMELLAARIWKDRFVSTCSVDCLDAFGTEYSLPHKAPLYARGTATVSLLDGFSGAKLPRGTVLRDSLSGKEYEVPSDVSVTSESLEIPLVALDFGADSNLDSGAELSFRDNVPDGLEDLATVVSVSGGLSVEVEIDGAVSLWGETAEEYRARLLNRIQNPPAGGAKNDYYQWAMRFSFVSDAFVFANYPNTNSVSVALANYRTESVAVPESNVEEARSFILSDVRRPVTADARVFSVTPVPVQIVASVAPYSQTVRDGVESALRAFFRKVSPGSTVAFSDVEIAVLSNAPAKTFRITSVRKSGAPVGEISLGLFVPQEAGSVDGAVAEVVKMSLALNNGEV